MMHPGRPRAPWLLGIAMVGALGCGPPETRSTAGPSPDDAELTPELARTILEAAPAFRIEESTVHVLEWQLGPGEEEGLWTIRKTPEGDRTRVTIEVLEASDWLERAEYFWGGVVPLHLRQPITRRVVEIVDMTDAEFPQMKEVRFTWAYVGGSDVLHDLKPELVGGPYPARARIQYQEDSWKVVGHLRDSRIEL